MFRKTIIAALLGFAAAAGAADPGSFGIGLGISLFSPPDEGANMTALYALGAHYWATRHVVPSLEVGYARYDADAGTFNYLPVHGRCAYHFGASKVFDPYLGAGLVYAHKWWEDDAGEKSSQDSVGYSGLGGIVISPSKAFSFGAGVEYVVPDGGDFDSGYPAFQIILGGGNY